MSEFLGWPDEVQMAVDELSEHMFSDLSRQDQRNCARAYVKGLVLATGRRSVRMIASSGHLPEQSLQHFIADSPWCWRTMRTRLTQWFESEHGIDAVVVRPVEIPKSGRHSAGVASSFSACLGKSANRQQLVAAWAVSGPFAIPVEWVLVIPPEWQQDPYRCDRARIPEKYRRETMLSAVTTAYHAVTQRLHYSDVPLVLDVTDPGFAPRWRAEILSTVAAMGCPYLMRVPNSSPVVVRSTSSKDMTQSAGWVARSAHHTLRPTMWMAWSEQGPEYLQTAAASVPVGVSTCAAGRPVASTLVFDRAKHGRVSSWLTNRQHADLHTTLALRTAVARARDQHAAAVDRVGLLDYAGRSFEGLHRHLSMAGIAQAAISEVGPLLDSWRSVVSAEVS